MNHLVPRLFALSLAALLALLAALSSSIALAAPTTVGYKDFTYSGPSGVDDPSKDKPQSKVWFADGWWWGGLFNSSDERYHIYKLDLASHTWMDTGVLLDDRNNSHADYMWDEADQKLYVASAHPTADQLVFRYSYNASTNTYSLDSGFPATVGTGGSETLTIAEDSTAQLWVTFTQPDVTDPTKAVVYVNASGAGQANQATWGTPSALPAQGVELADVDDIAAIIAFGGNRIGVMWSSRNPVGVPAQTSFYWSERVDTDPDGTWGARQTAQAGNVDFAEDHINLKLVTAGSAQVLAAVKLGGATSGDDNIALISYNGAGAFTYHPVFEDPGDHTRPQVVLDDEADRVYVFATDFEVGGNILYKSAPLSNLAALESASAVTFIDDPVGVNDISSTKQNANSDTGILGIATSNVNYFHNYLPLASHPFTDIGGHFFEDVIIWLFHENITQGCTGTRYCPESPVTREQMAAFLDRTLGLPDTTTDYFTDDEGSFAEQSINNIREANITTGCTATTFCPAQNVTREQMAAFLDRALDLPDTSTNFFTDDEGSWAEQHINNIAAAGITTGCTPTTYCPTLNITRGQMAAFLHRGFTGDI